MLIKKIEMLNFRQFIGKQIINFATATEKNITVIMGENGSGKTTFAQAFLWVLYSETEFKIKELINRVVRDNMMLNDTQMVKIDLHINHEGKDYIISRQQIFKKDYTSVKVGNSELTIAYNNNGQQEFLKPLESLSMIKKMLPKELSKFFFFDGERIKTMSDEIEKGKSKEFADAVRGLVGLTAIMNAITHLKPSTTNATVIGRFNNKIDAGGNARIADYSKRIARHQEEYDAIEKRIEEIQPQIDYYQKLSADLNLKIASFAPAEKLQAEYNRITNEIYKLMNVKNEAIKLFLFYFNKNTHAFLSKPLILMALAELAETEKLDKGMLDMHQKTVEYLLKRGFCVCGTKLDPGTEAFTEICKVMEYLPPKSIGTLIGQFAKESQGKTKLTETYFEMFDSSFKRIREIEGQIGEKITDQSEINRGLLDTSEVAGLKKTQLDADNRVKQFTNEMREKLEKKGATRKDKERLESERNELILVDSKNKQVEVYRQYAYCIYEELSAVYDTQEKVTRDELQKNINEVFTSIYEGGISINIDEKYNIRVSINDNTLSDDDLERSTAQNYSVIFSFIAGIIKMAKQKSKETSFEEKNIENIFYEAEGYPLVMDAPLSAFDKKRINNICDTLPKIAQQVIFFIKDTDGDVAEEHLGDIIGSKYIIKKVSHRESIICER